MRLCCSSASLTPAGIAPGAWPCVSTIRRRVAISRYSRCSASSATAGSPGYEDCNDHDTLGDDPLFKLIAERLPEEDALASQPTLSRFENLATPHVLLRLFDFAIETGMERLKEHHSGKLPAKITRDLDADAVSSLEDRDDAQLFVLDQA